MELYFTRVGLSSPCAIPSHDAFGCVFARLDPTEFQNALCIQERAESYASQAEQAGLTFEKDLPDQALMVHADKVQIGQALDNLVDNACKFTPAGAPSRVPPRQPGEPVDRF